jgi:heme/copper-type cytochrome/quinol oxidase subunit 2
MAIVLILAVVVVAAIGEYALSPGGSGSGAVQVQWSLVESDPVNQVDAFVPMNITVPHDSTVALAIQNEDDQSRTFEISAFNVTATIQAGATDRMTFTVGGPGTFVVFVPGKPPFEGFKASPAVTGYIIVT